MRCGRLLGLVAALAVVLAAVPAAAHPHVWIDLRSAAVLDDAGRVAAIRIEWLFDRFYSAFAQEDMDTDRNRSVSEAEAQLWAETAFGNIAEAGYFAEILVDGQSYVPSKASDPVGHWRDGQLFMSFVVQLDEPADPRQVTVGYLSYDPAFYIDIRHPETSGAATVEGPGHAECSAEIGRSEPSPEVVASAAALDRNETAQDGLGRLFADYVKVACR